MTESFQKYVRDALTTLSSEQGEIVKDVAELKDDMKLVKRQLVVYVSEKVDLVADAVLEKASA